MVWFFALTSYVPEGDFELLILLLQTPKIQDSKRVSPCLVYLTVLTKHTALCTCMLAELSTSSATCSVLGFVLKTSFVISFYNIAFT